jgi:hypothetical protein
MARKTAKTTAVKVPPLDAKEFIRSIPPKTHICALMGRDGGTTT